MAYASGSKILATDIQSQITDINTIMDLGNGNSGYGQGAISGVSAGGSITSARFLDIRNKINDAATHQGTTVDLPAVVDLQPADIIAAYTTSPTIPGGITGITTNKLAIDAGQSTIVASSLSSVRVAAWSIAVNHGFTVTFANQNAARYFFNQGGQIRIAASRTGGSSTPQNTDWTNLLSGAGTIVFDGTNYFNSLTTDQILNSAGGIGAYSTNDWTILWKTNTVTDSNGGKGSILTFNAQFNDDHTNPNFDSVDGTLTSTIGHRVSSGVITGVVPTFTTVSTL